MSPDESAWLEAEDGNWDYVNGEWAECEDFRHELRLAEDRGEELADDVDHMSVPRHLLRKWFKCPTGISKSPKRVARWQRSRQSVDAAKAWHHARDMVDSVWQPDSGYYAYYGGRPKPFDTKFEVVPDNVPEAEAAVSAAIAAIRDAADAYFNAVRSLMELLSDLPVALEVDIPDTWYEPGDFEPPGQAITSLPHLTNAPPASSAAPHSVGELVTAA